MPHKEDDMIKVRDIAPVLPPKVDAVTNTVTNRQEVSARGKPQSRPSRPGNRHRRESWAVYMRAYMARRRAAAKIGKTERSSTSSLS